MASGATTRWAREPNGAMDPIKARPNRSSILENILLTSNHSLNQIIPFEIS
jgi:hypothetical protein